MKHLAEQLLEEKPNPRFPITLVLFWSVTAAAIYFSAQKDYGTASAIALLGIAMRSGYRGGAATFLGLFAGGALALLVAAPLGKLIEPLTTAGTGTQGLTNRLLSIAVVGLSAAVITTLIVRYGVRRAVRDRPGFKSCDRWIGLGLGGLQGGLLLLIVASGLVIVEPLARDALLVRHTNDRSLSRLVSEQVVMASEAVQNGRLAPLLSSFNLLEHVVPLENLKLGVEVLRSPESLSTMANHPAVDELSRRPEFQATLNQLSEDPQLRDVLSSDEPITRDTLAALMRSPALLKLFDDKEFVSSLSDVLTEIDPQALLGAN